jgi:hypothetical protein
VTGGVEGCLVEIGDHDDVGEVSEAEKAGSVFELQDNP